MKSIVERLCAGLTRAKTKEIEEFLVYARQIGLIQQGASKDDLIELCQRYRQEKENLTREKVTGGERSPKSYTRGLQDAIDLVTIQKDILPVGSFKYNVHKWPSDVDLFEKIEACCSVEDTKKFVAKGVQRIGKLIRAAPDVYLGDFKAGKDDRFEVDIGKWVPLKEFQQERLETELRKGQIEEKFAQDPIWREFFKMFTAQEAIVHGIEGDKLALVGFDPKAIEKSVKRLRQQRLISFDELARITGLLTAISKSPTYEQWEELQTVLRDHQVLRWSPLELAQGFKMLPGFKKLKLEDALAQQTLVKIDAWARVNGKWMEVTNFFMVEVKDKAGQRLARLTQDLPDYVKSMSKDVKHYSSAEHRKTLKALKRLWALALFKNDLELANRITPLFSSNAAALNQIAGDAEVLALMLEKLDDPPLESIMEQIDGFKPRIDQMNEVVELNPKLFDLINSITQPFYDKPVSQYNQFDDAIAKLEELQKLVGSAVETMISAKAAEAGLQNPGEFV
jgi:hypothetical protein